MYPRTPDGRAGILPSPPWHYSGEMLTVEFRTDPADVAELLPPGLSPAPDDPGAVAIIWAANVYPDMSFVGDVIVVLYLLAIPSLMIVLGGSLSGNPHGAVGASREMKLLLAYELPFRPSTMRLLHQSMVGVVEAQNGTGKLARIAGIEVAGKTGTAQNPHGEDHSCFIAYAPADDPTIAVAVIAENAGGGGAIAAPMARQVMKAYLRIEDPEEDAPRVLELTEEAKEGEGTEAVGGADAGP